MPDARTFLIATLLSGALIAEDKAMTRFDFESDSPGGPPRGFELALTGKGRPGTWVVEAAPDAPSGKNVLAQTDGDTTDYRFPIAFTGPELKDLRLQVKLNGAEDFASSAPLPSVPPGSSTHTFDVALPRLGYNHVSATLTRQEVGLAEDDTRHAGSISPLAPTGLSTASRQ